LSRTIPIGLVTREIRSKNAGPFLITLDIIFNNATAYRNAKEFITKNRVAKLYGITTKKVLEISSYDQVFGIKVTILRSAPSGSLSDTDVYGCQQHTPLLKLRIPIGRGDARQNARRASAHRAKETVISSGHSDTH